MTPELAEAFRLLDDEPAALHARSIVELQRYIYGPMPSRLTLWHCIYGERINTHPQANQNEPRRS
jgi:hypothetical protein